MQMPKIYITYCSIIHTMDLPSKKKCALCEDTLPSESAVNICENCRLLRWIGELERLVLDTILPFSKYHLLL
jgi:hypothetical protein